MSAEPITDAEVVDEPGTPAGNEPEMPSLAVALVPEGDADDLVARLDKIKDAQTRAMLADVDYGVIPGTSGKPTLLKPGAEKLAEMFRLDVQCDLEEVYGPGDHLTVKARAQVYSQLSQARLGAGAGLCTTREKKYGKRKQERTCPNCGAPAVIKGKADYGGGWLCWAKKGGCNSKWPDGAEAIESQPQGEIENPDLPDAWNTVIKMAKKRAEVDAVLKVTGASAVFTQDVEDQGPQAGTAPPAAGPYYGPGASVGYLEQTRSAIRYVLDAPDDQAALNRVSEYLAKALPAGTEKPDGLPVAAAIGILGLAAELKERGEAAGHGETLPEVPA